MLKTVYSRYYLHLWWYVFICWSLLLYAYFVKNCLFQTLLALSFKLRVIQNSHSYYLSLTGLLWFLFKPQQYWEQWHLRELMLCVGSWWDLWRCGKDLAGHKTKLMVGRRPYLWHIRRSLVWLIQAFRCTHTHFRNYFWGEIIWPMLWP